MAEIITIEHPGDPSQPFRIHADEFDPERHTRFGSAPAEEPDDGDEEDDTGRITDPETGIYAEETTPGWYGFFSADGEPLDHPKRRMDEVAAALEALRG